MEKQPQVKLDSMSHIMMLQQRFIFFANINDLRLLTFLSKQHHIVGGIRFG
jgi:hypothetical protein